MQPFTVLIKPSGSDCNLDCQYCFYKKRAPEVGQGRQRMSDEVLEKFIKDYLALGFAVSAFAWQGGEPTLMGPACRSNKQCGLDDLFAMGLQSNPSILNKISAVTMPLGQYGPSPGFMLIYRSSENKLTEAELEHISAVTQGLCRAIQSCQALCQSAD